MRQQMIDKQKGFTLVEIAIVLVIIGLLLGGVLKGQEMIENGKTKNAVSDMNGITAAYNSYVDKYRQVPGDDGEANLGALQARGTTWATVTVNGNRNGVIQNAGGVAPIPQAAVFNPAVAQEGTGFWQHLKASGLISGNPADTGLLALPRNAFNGVTGVGLGVGTPATARFSICLSQIPGKAARAIDTQLDDSLPGSGSIMVTLGAVGVNTAPGAAAPAYSDDQVYTLCRRV
jgi:prepilin-type N-terminal cleavage/methylation domain-containing protein